MADKNIGALDQAPQLDDDSLLVVEQQGQAMKVTGAQFKEFGRQAVVTQVQGLVDKAEAAADRAVDAVSAVTDMTVEAHPSETATVAKTTKNGKVNLDFGLPRGERGEPGPEGPAGQRGPRGETGKGLTILGYYDTLDALRAAQPSPGVGDAYGIGTEPPYNIYVFDGVTLDWKDNGQLSGGGGTILPENVVTTPGGAELEFSSGDGPHTVKFTFEEEPPMTADDVVYSDTQTVKEAIDGLFTSVSDGKALIASAITDKGVPTAQDASFSDLAGNIGQIATGSSTEDATATAGDILAGKTAYVAAGKVEGQIPTLGAKTYTPGTSAQVIANGQYLGGNQTIQGDANLTSGNIKKGVSIFGVAGAMEQNFLATLTVTADTGAVVTATHTNGTKVEALSTNGTVTMELPLEGQWTVTARRGVAQYNSVVINVSSKYTAALTAEVHIEYFGVITNLSEGRRALASVSFGKYALFAGGYLYRTNNDSSDPNSQSSANVDVYDKVLTKTNATSLAEGRLNLAAAATELHAIFAGGYHTSRASGETYISNRVDVYNADLTKGTIAKLDDRLESSAGASIDKYILIGGGGNDSALSVSTVTAYDEELVKKSPSGLAVPGVYLAAASNANYAVFAGGNLSSGMATAYNASLTRSIPAPLGTARRDLSAAMAGNYVLFAGGRSESGRSSEVDAYDLFLTRTTPEELSIARNYMAASTLEGYGVFCGGSSDNGISGTVDVYDQYLVRVTAAELNAPREELSGASVGEYVLFGGGRDGSNDYSAVVEAYRYV